MKNPLQNKAVVAALAVVAAACVAGSFVEWPSRKPLIAAARELPAATAVPADTFEVPRRPAILERLAGNLGSSAFEPRGRSDPFAWPRSHIAVPTNPGSAERRFVISAISIDGNKAFAVINRQVVTRGERLGAYAVAEILPTEVWLRGPSGRVVLTLP